VETNQSLNLGLTQRFSNFSVVFSWFNRTTKDLLAAASDKRSSRDRWHRMQTWWISNKGAELDWVIASLQNSGNEVNFNISTYRNNVVYIDGDTAAHLDGDFITQLILRLLACSGQTCFHFYGLVRRNIPERYDYTKNNVTHRDGCEYAAGHFNQRC